MKSRGNPRGVPDGERGVAVKYVIGTLRDDKNGLNDAFLEP
jgi:hypothetical protein